MTLSDLEIVCFYHDKHKTGLGSLPLDSKPGQVIVTALNDNLDLLDQIKFCIMLSRPIGEELGVVGTGSDLGFNAIILLNDLIVCISSIKGRESNVEIRKLHAIDHIEISRTNSDSNVKLKFVANNQDPMQVKYPCSMVDSVKPYIDDLRVAIRNSRNK